MLLILLLSFWLSTGVSLSLVALLIVDKTFRKGAMNTVIDLVKKTLFMDRKNYWIILMLMIVSYSCMLISYFSREVELLSFFFGGMTVIISSLILFVLIGSLSNLFVNGVIKIVANQFNLKKQEHQKYETTFLEIEKKLEHERQKPIKHNQSGNKIQPFTKGLVYDDSEKTSTLREWQMILMRKKSATIRGIIWLNFSKFVCSFGVVWGVYRIIHSFLIENRFFIYLVLGFIAVYTFLFSGIAVVSAIRKGRKYQDLLEMIDKLMREEKSN